jgi:hypothetical protein
MVGDQDKMEKKRRMTASFQIHVLSLTAPLPWQPLQEFSSFLFLKQVSHLELEIESGSVVLVVLLFLLELTLISEHRLVAPFDPLAILKSIHSEDSSQSEMTLSSFSWDQQQQQQKISLAVVSSLLNSVPPHDHEIYSKKYFSP